MTVTVTVTTRSAMRTMTTWGPLLVALLFVSSARTMTFEDGEDVYVDTSSYGRVKGKSFPSQYHKLPNRWVNVYLGIPYAKRLEQFGNDWREKYRFMVSYDTTAPPRKNNLKNRFMVIYDTTVPPNSQPPSHLSPRL